eukprot:TRINITY_DN4603_c0_g1_i1.p1 TRINITY_DN4603_c0_g1~~TRINITY_DN4603_c0_g1_i1.p1  ORF type:complete len:275 (-),score=49.21 TRINITY_DN4603_c0_g1_i1:13-837(-)
MRRTLWQQRAYVLSSGIKFNQKTLVVPNLIKSNGSAKYISSSTTPNRWFVPDNVESEEIVDPHIHELRATTIAPEHLEDYLKITQANIGIKLNTGAKLIGFFTTVFGTRNQIVQIWEWENYKHRQEIQDVLTKNKDWLGYAKQVKSFIKGQQSSIVHQFDFWPFLAPEVPGGSYELRTYHLTSGSIWAWQSYWEQGLKYRSQYVHPVAGWYSETGGELDNVYHLWHYTDLDKRREMRHKPWKEPGWVDVVEATLPLIRSSESAILKPVDFSPLK